MWAGCLERDAAASRRTDHQGVDKNIVGNIRVDGCDDALDDRNTRGIGFDLDGDHVIDQ